MINKPTKITLILTYGVYLFFILFALIYDLIREGRVICHTFGGNVSCPLWQFVFMAIMYLFYYSVIVVLPILIVVLIITAIVRKVRSK